MQIDNSIAEAFIKASKEACKRQLASFEIMKHKSLKGDSLDYSV